MKMFCQRCGTENDDKSYTCVNCGAALDSLDTDSMESDWSAPSLKQTSMSRKMDDHNMGMSSSYQQRNNQFTNPNGYKDGNKYYAEANRGRYRNTPAVSREKLTIGKVLPILCLDFLIYIPILGSMARLIILIVFACDRNDNDKSVIAKSLLIKLAIEIVGIIILLLLMYSFIVEVFQDLMRYM